MNKYIACLMTATALAAFTSCENGDVEFPDYNGGTVYFASQYPVRTLVMGTDTQNDLSNDNKHKCQIYATMGGTYAGKDVTVGVAVDPTLVENLYFEDGTTPVKVLPSNYYSLSSDQIKYNGELMGSVDVQFTDAFFNDPDVLENNYVIPLVMTGQTGAETILSGTPAEEGANPARTNTEAWSVQPKDYVLYCVKYRNKYDAIYYRRGVDNITEQGASRKETRHGASVEKDEIFSGVGTKSLNQSTYTITINDANKQANTATLLLTFSEDGTCNVSSATNGVTASGTGKFVENGEAKAWGNRDRDALYLDYNVDFGGMQSHTVDTLVVQTRNIKGEYFTPVYKK